MKGLNRDARRGLRNLIIIGGIIVIGACSLFKGKEQVKALEINKTGQYTEGNNWSDFSQEAQEVLEGNSDDAKAVKEVKKKWDEVTNNIKARYGRNVVKVLPDADITILEEGTEFIKIQHRGESKDVAKVNEKLFDIMNSYENIISMWKAYSLDEDNFPNQLLVDEIMYNVSVIDKAYSDLIVLGKTIDRDRLSQVFSNLDARHLELRTGIEDLEKGFREGTKLYKDYGYSSLIRDRDNWISVFDLYEY